MIDSRLMTNLYDRLQTEVHVWFCQPQLIKDKSKLSEYESLLSEQETERYHRFHFDKDRHSYLVSHALLRQSLSRYSDVHASQWQFLNNEHGKPQLSPSSMLPGVYFNLTHTSGMSACVVTLKKLCGIDAEHIHRKNDLKSVAQRMFADEEVAQLKDDTINQQFYRLWTLREAYVKALGTGLAGSSKKFYFDIDRGDFCVRLNRQNSSYDKDEDWHFRLYEPTPDHVLAVGYQSQEEAQVLMSEVIP